MLYFFCSAKNFEDPFEGEFAWGHTGYKKFIETQEKLCATHGAGMDLEGRVFNELIMG